MTPLISAQLKDSTADLHRHVESKMSGVLFSADLTPEAYLQVLENMRIAYTSMENAVSLVPDCRDMMSERSKIALLDNDISFLEKITQSSGIKTSAGFDFSRVTEANAWGLLYVMEGATLGGAFICKRLDDHPWINHACLNFFASYGSERGAKWKSFQAALEEFISENPEQNEEVIDGAFMAFRQMDKLFMEN